MDGHARLTLSRRMEKGRLLMRWVLGAVLTAVMAFAAAEARSGERLPLNQCEKAVKLKYSDTTHCFLRIDDKTIINHMCNTDISMQLREFQMEVPGVRANVWMKNRLRDGVPEAR